LKSVPGIIYTANLVARPILQTIARGIQTLFTSAPLSGVMSLQSKITTGADFSLALHVQALTSLTGGIAPSGIVGLAASSSIISSIRVTYVALGYVSLFAQSILRLLGLGSATSLAGGRIVAIDGRVDRYHYLTGHVTQLEVMDGSATPTLEEDDD